MSSPNWAIHTSAEPKTLERVQAEHKVIMEWEKKILQRSIDTLIRELKEKNRQEKHLKECIKGEEQMISILKKVIAEARSRHSIDMANLTGSV